MNTLTIHLAGMIGTFSLHAQLSAASLNILGIFGDSAAGKTLLLRGIAGLEPRLKGFIRINQTVWQDAALGTLTPPHLRRVGYVFQEPRLLSHLTVEKNLKFAEKRMPTQRPQIQKSFLFDCLDVWDLLSRYPHQLSGGQQQRVALARAALSQPDVFLMDEPFSHLNQSVKDELLQFVSLLAHEYHRPILYVTHDFKEITRIASHVTFVEKGQFSPIKTLSEMEVFE